MDVMYHMIAKNVNEGRKKQLCELEFLKYLYVKHKLKCVKQIVLTCNECPKNEYSDEKTITKCYSLTRSFVGNFINKVFSYQRKNWNECQNDQANDKCDHPDDKTWQHKTDTFLKKKSSENEKQKKMKEKKLEIFCEKILNIEVFCLNEYKTKNQFKICCICFTSLTKTN